MEAASQGSIKVYWHELPLLGEASISAAKAALAAQRQGAYVNFHKRLMRTAFQVTPQYIEALAKDLSIDQDQLVSDMESEAVFRNLQESSALAQIFGFIGTPAIVVGRTVVQGEISDGQLLRLIEQERNDRSAGVCG
jgi:protein-disulfide isomerase